MSNKHLEKIFVETMKHILDQDDLGKVEGGVEDEHSHSVQFQREDIESSYALAVKKSDYFDALNAIFYKIHSYKWIDDEKFEFAMTNDLEAMGIPFDDIEIAVKGLEKVRKEYPGNEKDVGWPEDLEGIRKVTQEPHNKPVSDNETDTMSGDNEPFSGVGPDNVRPVKNEA